jgi:hypothetical protein
MFFKKRHFPTRRRSRPYHHSAQAFGETGRSDGAAPDKPALVAGFIFTGHYISELILKIHNLPMALGVTAALALQSFAPVATAQTASTYKYSVSITVSEPAGSAAALTAAGPKKPTSTKSSPCSSPTALDQLNFTLKYDAGKYTASADTRRSIYVIFNKPDLATGGYVSLVKKPLLSPAPFFVASDTAAATVKTNTYIAAADNLSVAQSEVLLGGNLRLEGLPTGLWSVTAIMADSTAVNFDDPATWDAWDVATFVLGKPWVGVTNTSCL